MSRRRSNLSLPTELIERMDQYMAFCGYGYAGRADLVKDVMCDFLREQGITKNGHYKKVK